MELRIKEVAKKHGFTLKKIAEKLGTSQAMVTYYDKGNVDISVDKLKEISGILGCEIAELLPLTNKYGHFYTDKEWQGIRKI